MGDLDLGAKVVLREDPDAVLRLARLGLPLRAIRLAPTEQIKLDRLMDGLIEAESEGVGRCWLHFEFLAAWRHDAPRTTFGRWSLAAPTHDPLLSVLVIMKQGESQGPPVNEAAWRFGPLAVNRFRFHTVCLWNYPVQDLLSVPSLAPFAPFAAGATEESVDEAMRRLEQVEPEARRVELRVALALLAGNVFPARPWLDTIPRELLMTSTTYQQIQAECEARGEARGRAEERARLLSTLLRARLHERAQPLIARLDGCSAEVATRAAELAGAPTTEEELLAALEALLPR